MKQMKFLLQPKLLYGQSLTGTRLMPKFGEASLNSIALGKPNMHAILADIRHHILSKRSSLYIFPSELDNMSQALIKKYPILCDADNPEGYVSTFEL